MVLTYDTDGNGNPEDYVVGFGLPDVDAAVKIGDAARRVSCAKSTAAGVCGLGSSSRGSILAGSLSPASLLEGTWR